MCSPTSHMGCLLLVSVSSFSCPEMSIRAHLRVTLVHYKLFPPLPALSVCQTQIVVTSYSSDLWLNSLYFSNLDSVHSFPNVLKYFNTCYPTGPSHNSARIEQAFPYDIKDTKLQRTYLKLLEGKVNTRIRSSGFSSWVLSKALLEEY